jgi:hypothetical protein
MHRDAETKNAIPQLPSNRFLSENQRYETEPGSKAAPALYSLVTSSYLLSD